MANSLKAILPALGNILGETPDALYGWQRALVREGLLDSVPGRGPGSGVAASPKTMAQFLIGICCQATRAENAKIARSMANAKAIKGPCPLTGASEFSGALSRILADPALAGRVQEVLIAQAPGQAFIRFDGADWTAGPDNFAARPAKSSIFASPTKKRSPLWFTTTIPAETVRAIAEELAR